MGLRPDDDVPAQRENRLVWSSLAQVTGRRGHGSGILGTHIRDTVRYFSRNANADGCTHLAQGNKDEHRNAHQWGDDEKSAHHTSPDSG